MGDYGRISVHEALGGGIVKKVYRDEDCSISGFHFVLKQYVLEVQGSWTRHDLFGWI
ncbi:hypothetical protein HanPI659440_Chr01g0022351 [Helianthus annuus]|nr:hypothetical protein HanPI659440_Chr01g0022351 [Helianthus annuus]